MFKNHLAMIGMNETPNKKAKFWQSYIRSLKGSDDIRAHDTPAYRRPILLFDEPDTAVGRINSPGYHYLPVHRETYGYSPRPIYDHHYTRSQRARKSNILPFPVAAHESFARFRLICKSVETRRERVDSVC
uniref:Myofilin n=1 Tax=Anopheles maculatus TaxID=74869 RepID=A0A182SI08_9DIPT